MNKITQKEMAFYKLYKAFKEDPRRWVAAWEFVGEMFIAEMNTWVLMSYKTPTNGLEIYFDNPGLLERDKIKGKSGSSYYGYRFAPGATAEKIIEPQLIVFYRNIKARELNPPKTPGTPVQQRMV